MIWVIVITVILLFMWAILAQKFDPILKEAKDEDGKIIEEENENKNTK